MGKVEMLKSVENYLLSVGKFEDYEKKILEAMTMTDRKEFVSWDFAGLAYFDSALPIGEGQTISQPSTVARMIQLLKVREGNRVLEIGTGSGWNACLIGYLVGEKGSVLSLEVVDSLLEESKRRIEKLGIKNVSILKKDFRSVSEKFDRIIFTAGILKEQEDIIRNYARDCLKDGGVLLCPHREGRLIILEKKKNIIRESQTKEEYVFVNLIL